MVRFLTVRFLTVRFLTVRFLTAFLLAVFVASSVTSCTGAHQAAGATGTPRTSGQGASSPVSPLRSSSPVVAAAACTAGQLRLVPTRVTELDGQLIDGFYVANLSTAACEVGGFPGAELVDASGRAIPLRLVRGGGLFSDPSDGRFTLDHDRAVSFNVQVPGSASAVARTCWTASSVRVSLPGTGGNLVARATGDGTGYRGCGGSLIVDAFYAPVFGIPV